MPINDARLSRAHRSGAVLAACALAAACGGDPSSKYDSIGEGLCPGGTTLEGVDVSEWQHTIDWPAVKSAGKVFAIARISDGSYLDTTFDANWPAMKSAGLIRGAYQYFEPGESPSAQATIVAQKVGRLGDGDLPVVADVETSGRQSAATIVANLQTWAALVKTSTGKTPMIYTAPYFWNNSVGSTAFGSNPLWIANWGVTCPSIPTGWNAFKVWQYSDTGLVSGISVNVDHDKFNGTLAELQAFAGGGSAGSAYAATFVSQTWPYATTTIAVTTHEVLHASIVLKNTGTATWNSNTKLATTQPRDRTSPFAGPAWPGLNRLAAVTGTVPPGSTFTFAFDWHAPAQAGAYDEFYGMVQEGAVWFSDPGQGGPSDGQIQAKFQVTATDGGMTTRDAGVPVTDAGVPVTDGGMMKRDAGVPVTDAGEPVTDAGIPVVDAGVPPDQGDAGPAESDAGSTTTGEPDAGAPGGNASDAGHVMASKGGCGCGSSSGGAMPFGLWLLLVTGLIARPIPSRRSARP